MDRERYKATCCECSTELWATKSIGQRAFGKLDAGHGTCFKCNTFLNLTFSEDKQEFKTMKWDDYVKTLNTGRTNNG